MSDINPEIIKKIQSFPEIPSSLVKLINEILVMENQLEFNPAKGLDIDESYHRVIKKYVDDKEILEYLNKQGVND